MSGRKLWACLCLGAKHVVTGYDHLLFLVGVVEKQPKTYVMDYIAGTASESHGTLIAPIDGIHGWYFANPALSRSMWN